MTAAVPAKKKVRVKFKVVCLECGKKFATSGFDPECPKCGGVDIEVR